MNRTRMVNPSKQIAFRLLTALMMSAAIALITAIAGQPESPHPVLPADI